MQPKSNSNKNQIPVDGRSQRRIDNGQRLLDAAIELLEHKSYHDISVEDICEAAGVGRATFFRAFKSKSGLIIEYNRQLAEKVNRQLAILDPQDAIQALRIVAAVFAENYASASPGLVCMAIEHILTVDPPTQEEAIVELVGLFDGIVKKGLEEGSLKGDLPSQLTATLILYRFGIAANYWFFHQELDIQQLMKDTLNGWLYGAANKDY